MQAYKVENDEILIVNEETGEPGFFSEKDIGEAFAKSLREIRKAAGLTLVQLGEIIGMPNQTLSAYERNIRIPSISQALNITAYFGFTIEDFITSGLGLRNLDIVEEYELTNPPQN